MISFIARLLSDGATADMPFVDVPASAWYYNEVQWAWANGLTVGTNDGTTFSRTTPASARRLLSSCTTRLRKLSKQSVLNSMFFYQNFGC